MGARSTHFFSPRRLAVLAILILMATSVGASDWPQWRGPWQNGSSEAEDLISTWSRDGSHLIWRSDFTGRSTPVVLDGHVYVTGRAGEGDLQREVVAAFDARNGERLWERNISTALTTVPFNRAGWAGPVADPETGYVYVQGIAGPFLCLDRDGEVVWERHLYEEFGRYSGYGGRTHTALIDGDHLIVSVINSAWGRLGPPRHRYFSFDKRTGEVLWVSTPGSQPEDLNTQSHGVVAVIGGRRLFVGGNADGNVYALDAHTGEKVWSFELSKRGINSTPVVRGDLVYIGHSEENVDQAVLGRTVAIDGTGKGDVTKTHEVWRRDIAMGFPSPLLHGDRLYVMDNSANLYALDAATGETHWELSVGTVGKSAPVWADGKIYVTEVNGHFWIIEPGDDSAKVLDQEELEVPSGRYAETYGSPAIAYGRIYFTTEEGVYSLGDPDRTFEISESPRVELEGERAGSDDPALLQIVPAEAIVGLDDTVEFEVRVFNEVGRQLETVSADWSLDGLQGSFESPGHLVFEGVTGNHAGEVVARHGELEARARLRVFADPPYEESFDSIAGRGRPWWIGTGRYQISELDGEKVLEKPVADSGLLRSNLLLGPPGLKGYTVQAEARGSQNRRRRSDVGLINSGYLLDLKGVRQELEIKSWESEKRIATVIPFEWEMDTWYVLKLQVERGDDTAQIRGKVWKKGDPEPEAWTLEVVDPLPVASGAPGVFAYSPAPAYFDNFTVTTP